MGRNAERRAGHVSGGEAKKENLIMGACYCTLYSRFFLFLFIFIFYFFLFFIIFLFFFLKYG